MNNVKTAKRFVFQDTLMNRKFRETPFLRNRNHYKCLYHHVDKFNASLLQKQTKPLECLGSSIEVHGLLYSTLRESGAGIR